MMNFQEQLAELSATSQQALADMSQAVRTYRPSWRTAGYVAIAAATGGVASAIVLKGALALKGVILAQSAMKTAMATHALTAPVTTAGTLGGGAAGLGLSRQQEQAADETSTTQPIVPPTTNAVTREATQPDMSVAPYQEPTTLLTPLDLVLQPVSSVPVVATQIALEPVAAEPIAAEAVPAALVAAEPPASDEAAIVAQDELDVALKKNAPAAKTAESQPQINAATTVTVETSPTGAGHSAPVVATSPEKIAERLRQGIVADRFEMLEGVAPSHAYTLNQAGILTYQDLAGQNPEALCTLINDSEVDAAICGRWIQQARQKARQAIG